MANIDPSEESVVLGLSLHNPPQVLHDFILSAARVANDTSMQNIEQLYNFEVIV